MHFIKAIDGNDTEPSSTFGIQPTTEVSQTTTMTTFFTDDQNLYTYYKNPQGAKLLFYSIKIVVLIIYTREMWCTSRSISYFRKLVCIRNVGYGDLYWASDDLGIDLSHLSLLPTYKGKFGFILKAISAVMNFNVQFITLCEMKILNFYFIDHKGTQNYIRPTMGYFRLHLLFAGLIHDY